MNPPARWYQARLQNVSGPGDPALYKCWQEHLDWSWTRTMTNGPAGVRMTMPYYVDHTFYPRPTATSRETVCDVLPRLPETEPMYITITHTNESGISHSYPPTATSPTCTLNSEECTFLHSRFTTSAWSIWNSYNSIKSWPQVLNDPNTLSPPCEIRTTCGAPPGKGCSMFASYAAVFYWPTRTPLPHCTATGKITVPASPASAPAANIPAPTSPLTGPQLSLQTAVVLGKTVTSPSALIIFTDLMAETQGVTAWSFAKWCGKRHHTATVVVDQNELSGLYQFTIPTAVHDMDPLWKFCSRGKVYYSASWYPITKEAQGFPSRSVVDATMTGSTRGPLTTHVVPWEATMFEFITRSTPPRMVTLTYDKTTIVSSFWRG